MHFKLALKESTGQTCGRTINRQQTECSSKQQFSALPHECMFVLHGTQYATNTGRYHLDSLASVTTCIAWLLPMRGKVEVAGFVLNTSYGWTSWMEQPPGISCICVVQHYFAVHLAQGVAIIWSSLPLVSESCLREVGSSSCVPHQ